MDHVRNHPRWDPDIYLEEGTEGPVGMGTVIRRRVTRSGAPVQGTMEITEFELDRSTTTVISETQNTLMANLNYLSHINLTNGYPSGIMVIEVTKRRGSGREFFPGGRAEIDN